MGTKPKNMTPEQERAWLDKAAARNKEYRNANKEKERARQKSKKPEKVAAYKKKWNESNKEKTAAWSKERRKRDPEKAARFCKNCREKLTRGVVAARLGLHIADCSQEIIELKREQMRIYRITKQLKKEIANV